MKRLSQPLYGGEQFLLREKNEWICTPSLQGIKQIQYWHGFGAYNLISHPENSVHLDSFGSGALSQLSITGQQYRTFILFGESQAKTIVR